MAATNSAKKVKLRNLFHIGSNPKITLFSLDFYATALFEKSEWISNWIINQHQLISVLQNINKKFLKSQRSLATNCCTPSPFLLGDNKYLKYY